MDQLLNQEVARLRHAELLRNMPRHRVEKETELKAVAQGFRARVARLIHHTPSSPPVRAAAR